MLVQQGYGEGLKLNWSWINMIKNMCSPNSDFATSLGFFLSRTHVAMSFFRYWSIIILTARLQDTTTLTRSHVTVRYFFDIHWLPRGTQAW